MGPFRRTASSACSRCEDTTRVDPIDRIKELHLTDVDPAVADDRVRHRDMEIDVWIVVRSR